MLSPLLPVSVPEMSPCRPPRRAHTVASAVAVAAIFASSTVAGGLEHVVEPGETLGGIARVYGGTVSEIAEANGLSDPDLIIVGQVLTLPDGSADGVSGETHTVAAGDTLSALAARYGTTVSALADVNGLTNPDFVREGTTLSIPESAGSAPPVAQPETPAPTTTHVVVAGETLGTIARQYDVTISVLVDANAIANQHFVREGTTLVVPEVAPEATAPPAEEDPPEAEAEATPQTDTGTVVGTQAAPLLDQWAGVYGVPPDLLKSLTWFESGWNNELISDVGAIGVGQLMPDTVDFVSEQLLGEPVDPHNLSDNVRASARLLRYLLDETGWDAAQTLGAYYQGLASIRSDGIYASSWFYIDGILALRTSF